MKHQCARAAHSAAEENDEHDSEQHRAPQRQVVDLPTAEPDDGERPEEKRIGHHCRYRREEWPQVRQAQEGVQVEADGAQLAIVGERQRVGGGIGAAQRHDDA